MIKITPQQAYDIINSSERVVSELNIEQKVFFEEDMDGKEALFYYDEDDDNSVILAYKTKLDQCQWVVDKDYIEATIGKITVFQGTILIKPSRDYESLVG